MAVQTWTAGVVAAWTAATGTEINSLASGNAVISSIQIDNSVAGDTYMDVSVSLGSVTPGAGAPYVGIYVVGLNEDGSTYGDGRFSATAVGPPASQYFRGAIPCIASTAGVIVGRLDSIPIPFDKFKVLIYNGAGIALASSANVVDYRTKNLKVV